MDFDEFLLEISNSKLLNPKYIPTLMAVFGKQGRGKSIKKCREEFLNDQPRQTTETYLKEIYKFFWEKYPELPPVSGNVQRKVLTDYFVKLYEKRKDIDDKSDRLQPPTNPSNIPTPEPIPELTTLGRDRSQVSTNLSIASDSEHSVEITTLNYNFIGREAAIRDLDAIVGRGDKVIVIQAKGGVGKTTLAQHYLKDRFKKVIEFPIAKRTEDVASIEVLLEEKLRELGEEPGREFLVSLARLKRKLQSEKVGILVDNLEPALNNGKFVESHRRYVEFLRVLVDSDVQSLTLITSRERLRETAVIIEHYPLSGLDLAAWQQFFQESLKQFSSKKELIIDASALKALHNIYGGNAQAMKILWGTIRVDFGGDIQAYWQVNQNNLMIEQDLEDLVEEQFHRLERCNLNAYNLLCRMGCYRFQDVPTVPIEGLFCVLWDIAENLHRRVIQALCDRSLVEVAEGQYWIHPVIREIALRKLSKSIEYETTNRKAAEFWQVLPATNDLYKTCLKKLESYYHLENIKDYASACIVIFSRLLEFKYSLIGYLRGFGYIEKSISILESFLKQKTSEISNACIIEIKGNLGDFYSIKGMVLKSIEMYKDAGELILKYPEEFTRLPRYTHYRDNIKHWYCDTSIAPLALIYFNICDYMSSIHYSEKALELCSDLKSAITGTLYCCASIACFYEDQIDRSELYFELATSDHYISEDKDGSSWWYIYGNLNLVRVLFIYQKPEEIKKISDDLLQYAKEFSYPLAEAIGLYALAKASFLEQSYEKYESNLLTAKVIFEKYSYNFELADTNYDLGQFYLNTGNNDRGHSLLQEAIDLYTKMEAPKQIERVKKAFEQGAMK